MQCTDGGPLPGDIDDEIAELRIEALLTKRENEAEVSKPPPSSYSQPMHQPHRTRMSGYNRYGNSYNHNRPPYREFYNTFRHHNPYHPSFAGKTVNSSNIVVLTSSENDSSINWQHRQKIPYKSQPYQPPLQVANNVQSTSSVSKLILPQDKYSKPPPNILANNDNKTKQMSARMKRLQGSGSESDDSDSDSSSDSSSSSSSSSDTSSSSDSSSNEDSDSEIDSKIKKKKLVKGKDDNQGTLNTVGGKSKTLPISTSGNANGKIPQDERPSSIKEKQNVDKLKQSDDKIVANKVDIHAKLRKSRTRSPMKRSKSPIKRSRSPIRRSVSPRFRSRSPRLKSRPNLGSRSPRARPLSLRGHSRSPRFRARTPRMHSRSPRFRSRTPPRLRSRTPQRLRSRTPQRFRSRTPQRLRSRTPPLRPRSPGFRSMSPRKHLNSPKRWSRSPRLRPLSPRLRSRSPKRRSRSPYKQLRSPRQRKPASDHRPFTPSPKMYRKSVSPYRPTLSKVSQRIGSRSPRFKSRLSRSPISPMARRKGPFRSRSRTPLTRGGSPIVRRRSPSPYSRRHSPSLYKRSPLPRLYSPAKLGNFRGIPDLNSESPRFKHRPATPPLRTPCNLDHPNNYLHTDSSGYSKLNVAPQFSRGIQHRRWSRSPPLPGSRNNMFSGRSQSPAGMRDFYKESYAENRQNQPQNRFSSKYAAREQQKEYYDSREINHPANMMRRSLSPWRRDVAQRPVTFRNFEPSQNSRATIRPILTEKENEDLTQSAYSDMHNRPQFRGRGRLLGSQRGRGRGRLLGSERGRATREHLNISIAGNKGERAGWDDNPEPRDKRSPLENIPQIRSTDHTISPFIDPSITYKNRAGERHIPYSLFEGDLNKKTVIQSKNEPVADHIDPKRSTRESSNRQKERPIQNRLPEVSVPKRHSSMESKGAGLRISDVRKESKISKSKPASDKVKTSQDSTKSKKSNESDRSHLTKKTKSELSRHKKDLDADKQRSNDRSKSIKAEVEDKTVTKDRSRIKEVSPKPKVPKGPRTPSYSPEIETQINPEQWANAPSSLAGVELDLAALSKKRSEIEKKLKEEEALLDTVVKDEEERIKNARAKEEKVMADRAKEKLMVDKVKEDNVVTDKGVKDGRDLETAEGAVAVDAISKSEFEKLDHRSQIDESYLKYNKKANLQDISLNLKDRRPDSEYDLQTDILNISDIEFNRTLNLEESGDIMKKKKKEKMKKIKEKKKKSKDKKDKHRKEKKEKKKKKDSKKKKRKEKKESSEKKKNRDQSTSPRKHARVEVSKQKYKHKLEVDESRSRRHRVRSPKDTTRLPRDPLPVLQVHRRCDSVTEKVQKRKRDDTRDSTRVEKRSKMDHKMEGRGSTYDKEQTNKGIMVTVGEGTGADRLVTSGRKSYTGEYKSSSDIQASKPTLPVHLRLGRTAGTGNANGRKRHAMPSVRNQDRRRGR